jgi:hypothetical protein
MQAIAYAYPMDHTAIERKPAKKPASRVKRVKK